MGGTERRSAQFVAVGSLGWRRTWRELLRTGEPGLLKGLAVHPGRQCCSDCEWISDGEVCLFFQRKKGANITPSLGDRPALSGLWLVVFQQRRSLQGGQDRKITSPCLG